MKKITKLLSIMMVLALVLSLGVSAMAATVEVDSKLSNHQFTAYAIFTGTQTGEDGDEKLASIEWGTGFDSASFLGKLAEKWPESFEAGMTAAKAAEALSALNLADDSESAKAVAEFAADCIKDMAGITFAGDAESVVLPDGYYLIQDTTENLNGSAAYNDVVLQATRTVKIDYKTDVPQVEKKVKDVNDSVANSETGWQDGADYDIGDDVPFQLTGTLPNNYGDYDTYAITFHDEQSAGLSLNADSVKVMAGDVDITSATGVHVVTSPTDGCAFEVVIDDLKVAAPGATAETKIVVTYTSKLTGAAVVIGPGGNPNEVYMSFSNNAHGEGTGTTPKDKVTVYTFELDIEKVKPDLTALEGAGFTLYKWTPAPTDEDPNAGDWTKIGDEITGVTKFEFKGLDDGMYRIEETTVPPGYNKADDIEFTVTDSHTENDGGTNEQDMGTLEVKVTAPVDEDGNPKGTITVNGGVMSTQVVNNSGLELPETGGIGTTIFYVVGAILVAGAVILLVTKKRMSGADK